MLPKSRRAALVVAALAVGLVMLPTAASATSWGILNVYENNNLRGQAHGTASIVGATRATTTSIYSGTPAEGTRVETQYYFWKLSSSGDEYWALSSRLDTPTWNSTKLHTASVSLPLTSSASKVRMVPRICVPKPWGTPVPCSNSAFIAINY